jgi:hypothetical protein
VEKISLSSFSIADSLSLSQLGNPEAEAAASLKDGTAVACARKASEDLEAAVVPEWVKQHWQQTKCDKALRESEDTCTGTPTMTRVQRELKP